MNRFTEVQDALKMLGLNSNAIKFYLTSYKIGLSSVGKVAQVSKLDRSSAYLAADQLKVLGLMDEARHGKRNMICVRSPKILLSRLRAQARKFRNQCLSIENQLPLLMAEYSQRENQPVLHFFSEKEGLKQIEHDILEYCSLELLVFSNQREEKMVFDSIDHKEFIKERMKKGIKVRVLSPDTPEAHDLKKKDDFSMRETRIITGKEIPFTNEIYIYNDKIAMLEFVDEIQGFIVKSKTFADTQRWLFEKIWEMYG